ncbi:hypothetical protein K7X08_011889 [Anisodus acutangulus]|uniref:RNA helicase n=1 Tax=Anisodus acutangulus TaxID=402998 RepID=A0A9Q1QWK2_9SOLA|nr:hypothetical protein K7X08_011889 [Anisodus acutangulus]
MDKIIRFNEKHGRGRNPLALVLAPTRELAKQVDKEFFESAPGLDTLCVYGSVPISRQMSSLDRGVDIVVGTPGFCQGQFNALVATDVAARGLDVPNVDMVVHYELPNSSEIFVHRFGRTGRAGKKGSAVLIHSSGQHRDVKGIERDVGCKFIGLPRIDVEAGATDMFSDMRRGGGRFGSYGGGMRSDWFGDSGHSGGYGNSSGRFGGQGRFSGRTGRFGGSGSGQLGCAFGGSSSGRSGNFGGSGDIW